MVRFIRRLAARRPVRPFSRNLLILECLEDRCLLSSAAAIPIAQPTYEVVQGKAPQPSAAAGFTPAGFSPQQVQTAYGFSNGSGFTSLNSQGDYAGYNNNIAFPSGSTTVHGDGTGQTIALVDAYNDPSIASDLTTFDSQFGLPAPANFIQVGVNSLGTGSTTSLPAANPGWAGEIELDVEWAHAMAPNASILLVEAQSDSLADLLSAVNFARNYTGQFGGGAVSVVSMSWSAGEFSGQTAYDSYFTTPANHVGVTFFASSGDTGSPSGWPAYSANVIGVGGTSLYLNGSGTYQSETAWSGSGGGLSMQVSQPSYQNNLVIHDGSQVISANGMRAAPDVAYDADPYTGVAVYGTYGFGGWEEVGGTSAGSPQWSALMAIADQGLTLANQSSLDGFTQTLPDLYALPSSDFHAITTGSNGGYAAGPGFNLVTGLGTPLANKVVAGLVGTPAVNQVFSSVSLSPGSATVADGGQQQFTATAFDQFGEPMNTQPAFTWSVSGLGSVSSAGLYSAPSSSSGNDTVQATATVNGVTFSASAAVTYLPGPVLSGLAATPNPATGTTANLTATVSDPNGASMTYAWSVLSSPVGAAAPTVSPASGSPASGSIASTATFYQAGAYQFQLTVTDALGVSTSSSVSVTVNQTFTSVVVAPYSVTLADGAQQQFTATANDQFGSAMAAQPAITWSVASGPGSIGSGGLYVAPSSFSGTTAAIQATASVNGVIVNGAATVTLLVPPTITLVAANPNPVTGTTTTLGVGAYASDGGGTIYYSWVVASAPSGAPSPIFSVNKSATAYTTTVTFFRAGAYSFQVTVGNLNGVSTGQVAVTVNQHLSSIMVNPGALTIQAGSQAQFTAVALDQFQQPMAPAPAVAWSVSGPGTITTTGLYTAPLTASGTAMVGATATVNGVTAGSAATITITPVSQAPRITSISATPNPTGTTATLSVAATSPSGGSLVYHWMALSVPSGASAPQFSVNNTAAASTTTATFYRAGTYTFQVMVTTPSGQMTSAQVAVTVQPVLTSVMVSPSPITVRTGQQQQFMAYAFDQFHMPLQLQPTITWSVLSGPGTINASGLYTASAPGPVIIEATVLWNGIALSVTDSVTVM